MCLVAFLESVVLGWMDRFLGDCQRPALAAASLDSCSLKLRLLTSDDGLDLAVCRGEDLLRVLGRLNVKYARKYYQDWCILIRQVLRFLAGVSLLILSRFQRRRIGLPRLRIRS